MTTIINNGVTVTREALLVRFRSNGDLLAVNRQNLDLIKLSVDGEEWEVYVYMAGAGGYRFDADDAEGPDEAFERACELFDGPPIPTDQKEPPDDMEGYGKAPTGGPEQGGEEGVFRTPSPTVWSTRMGSRGVTQGRVTYGVDRRDLDRGGWAWIAMLSVAASRELGLSAPSQRWNTYCAQTSFFNRENRTMVVFDLVVP